MKKIEKWLQDHKVFHVELEELLKHVQVDAYNEGVKQCKKAAKLKSTLCNEERNEGTRFQTYLPGKGIKTVEIDFSAIKTLSLDDYEKTQIPKTKK